MKDNILIFFLFTAIMIIEDLSKYFQMFMRDETKHRKLISYIMATILVAGLFLLISGMSLIIQGLL